ncbi:MAG: hypothetical protein QOG73_1706 [Acetobacteraceae bacterium]|nr:hypothetical protein [Acetobacteraceae bacterium]
MRIDDGDAVADAKPYGRRFTPCQYGAEIPASCGRAIWKG